jgi:hypothetical protein
MAKNELKAADFVLCPGCGDPVRKSKLEEAEDGLFGGGDHGMICPLCDHEAPADAFKPVKAA